MVMANRHLQRTPQHSRSTGSCAFNGTFAAQSVGNQVADLVGFPTDALRRDGVHLHARFLNGSHTGVGNKRLHCHNVLNMGAERLVNHPVLRFGVFGYFRRLLLILHSNRRICRVPLGRPAEWSARSRDPSASTYRQRIRRGAKTP